MDPEAMDLIPMDNFYVHGVHIILWWQKMFGECTWLFLLLSRLGDPRYSYIVYFPAVYAFDTTSGIRVLWAAAVGEWLNLIAKWLLNGERPYWWVAANAGSLEALDGLAPLQQFSATCETGPGSPSGHMMVTGGVWLIITYLVIHYQCADINTRLGKWLCCSMTVGSYLTLMFGIAASRWFIAAHFPHQCLLGFIAGLLMGYFILRWKPFQMKFHSFAGIAVLMVLSFLATIVWMKSSDVDFDWAYSLALRYCKHREWIHISTRPTYTLCRFVATVIGIGIALKYYTILGVTVQAESLTTKAVRIALSISLNVFLERTLTVSSLDNLAFVTCAVFYMAFPLLVIVLIPRFFQLFTNDKKKRKR